MKAVMSLALFLLLSACAMPVVDRFDYPPYKIPVGSVLVLNQAITIPAGHTRAIIQHGKVVTRKQSDQYYPYCEFEVLTLKDTDQVVNPDRFIVHKFSRQRDTSSQTVMFASLSMFGFDPPLIAYNTILYLSSQKQPDVYRISCMYWTDDSLDNFLTVNQLKKTLGNLFTLQID